MRELPRERRPRPPGLGTSPAASGYRVGGRMWIEKEGETFLSWGRIVLLEQIRARGSIAAAARSMGMGYRHAWELVTAMNRLAPTPLVTKVAGGPRGGGTRLTRAGDLAIERFWGLVGEFRGWLREREPGMPRRRPGRGGQVLK